MKLIPDNKKSYFFNEILFKFYQNLFYKEEQFYSHNNFKYTSKVLKNIESKNIFEIKKFARNVLLSFRFEKSNNKTLVFQS